MKAKFYALTEGLHEIRAERVLALLHDDHSPYSPYKKRSLFIIEGTVLKSSDAKLESKPFGYVCIMNNRDAYACAEHLVEVSGREEISQAFLLCSHFERTHDATLFIDGDIVIALNPTLSLLAKGVKKKVTRRSPLLDREREVEIVVTNFAKKN